MNVLEKILEEIENLGYYPEGMGCGIEDCGITDRYEACEYGWNEAIEAVVEVINNMNDVPDINAGEWIPVSERLPNEQEFKTHYRRNHYAAEFIVTINGATKSTTLYFKNGFWFDEENNYYNVLAWKPLPESYRPEPEQQPEPNWRQRMMDHFQKIE